MASKAKHIYPVWVVLREVFRRVAIMAVIRYRLAIKTVHPKHCAPYAIT